MEDSVVVVKCFSVTAVFRREHIYELRVVSRSITVVCVNTEQAPTTL
jgi:hypothetical protein